MTDRVLVADDSLTIQKVVGITLASSGYELVEAHNEAELFEQLNNNEFKLVLLDFNLSENQSGYDLAKTIRSQSPQSTILGMLGTFDTVDDIQMEQAGIDDKIVKPFDSDKFIQKCRTLIEEGSDIQVGDTNFDGPVISEVEDTNNEEDELGSGWVVDSPKPQDDSSSNLNAISSEEVNSTPSETSSDVLAEEMMGWGMEIPGVIGSTADLELAEFPPVIDETTEESNSMSAEEQIHEVEEIIEDDFELPAESDLDYPDMGQESQASAPTSELMSIDELAPQEDEQEDLDATDPGFQMPEEFTNELASEIDAEVSADDFWAVDDTDANESISFEDDDEEPYEVTESDSEIKISASVMPEEQAPIAQAVAPVAAIDEDALVEKLTQNMKPMIEELIKQYCEKSVEQVAWEVIPDLAENLIRKEIKDLADSVR